VPANTPEARAAAPTRSRRVAGRREAEPDEERTDPFGHADPQVQAFPRADHQNKKN